MSKLKSKPMRLALVIACLTFIPQCGDSVQSQSPAPTPEISMEQLRQAEKELQEELEGLKAEAESIKYQAVLEKTIKTSKLLNQQQKSKLDSLNKQLSQANADKEALIKERDALKAEIAVRKKQIANLEKLQKKTKRQLVVVSVVAVIFAIISIVR